MILAIALGKGGTSKTTVALNLARTLGSPVRLLDRQVKGPDDHLFLRGTLGQSWMRRVVGVKRVGIIDAGRTATARLPRRWSL